MRSSWDLLRCSRVPFVVVEKGPFALTFVVAAAVVEVAAGAVVVDVVDVVAEVAAGAVVVVVGVVAVAYSYQEIHG